MREPVKWIFFCSEADYPKFLALVTSYPLFRPTYDGFVKATDDQIKRNAEQQSREKVWVSFEDFEAYRSRPENAGKDDVRLLNMLTHLSWGDK
jgi:hypothetical protein